MQKETAWCNLKASELRQLATENAIVVVPIGSIEQHGPHLPVQVDALLAGEVCRRAAEYMADSVPVTVTPTIWSGLAEHHMSFGGTLTLDFDTFRSVIRCICRSIQQHGFMRIALINGHGGNIAALTVISAELTLELNATVACATYWHVAEKEFNNILEAQQTVRHAGEAETSMLLALCPELVDQQVIATFEPPTDGLGAENGVYRWRPIKDWSDSGVIGVPAAATAEKGVQLLEAAGKALATQLANSTIWRD